MNENDIQLLVGDGLQRVSEAAAYLSVSRSYIYKLINLGILPSVKIGNSRRIPIRAVHLLASVSIVRQPSRG
jgi:excisionase family DNA binding protein